MKIEVKQTIDVPDKLICATNKHICIGLTAVKEADDAKVCSYFNKYVWWSDRAGFFLRCKDCIEAQRAYLEGKDG